MFAYFVSALRYFARLLQVARLKCVNTRRDPFAVRGGLCFGLGAWR